MRCFVVVGNEDFQHFKNMVEGLLKEKHIDDKIVIVFNDLKKTEIDKWEAYVKPLSMFHLIVRLESKEDEEALYARADKLMVSQKCDSVSLLIC